MAIQCELCPKYCFLSSGQSGECRIRINIDDKLLAVTYNHPCAVHIDPIEKKPLFHFLPGSEILSIATAGCNLHCKNCQNWEISQANPEDMEAYHIPAEELLKIALQNKTPSIAYTYTDPFAYYEYTYDSSVLFKKNNIKNVLVTAGYINEPPLRKLLPFIDAANIDLKALSDKFYREVCSATLKPVLETLVITKSMGVELEITNLIIPTLNDSDYELTELSNWIKTNLGKETPLHFSRFYPHYKMKHLPPTPSETLLKAREIAKAQGLENVYIGNLLTKEGENTYCPKCNKLLIKREGFSILENHIKNNGCMFCEKEIYGVWK
ncbi:MAG: hypothetical protein ACD_79C00158G0005 [uncultured bacterium]|nr:MAG: hypothetical protein ACD_79C00158G0005 [uncultured bacterium]